MIPYSDANIPLLIHIRLADLFTFIIMWGIDVFAYEKLVSHVSRVVSYMSRKMARIPLNAPFVNPYSAFLVG
jgi:hypothetical protein